ncbi:beta-N-acetyl-D-glucosaminide beta-1,4-N-acetylglucosaminyl-transferase-like [Haliotis rubra]|uniref:beta-N-acetyl-D-glucosaminide beta-1,4-N-acetylglucosaminyl-transferase-like n=1 Tax=Haliotis rubra TaxID=36100 RepID=UPI001EE60E9B|nr:beta-N-acetyl-D-glucosaminide beta-1,4-N-acetylglucosaminyl-transferase-like [Haliotis rubra]
MRIPNISEISHDALKKKYLGGVDGHFSPPTCVSEERTAVIIPSDDNPDNIRILLNNLIPVLRNQNKDFTLFVVEQTPDTPFNKALLMNAGFVEAVRQDVFTCVIFHDVDLIPVTYTVPYGCLKNHPHYLSVTTSNYSTAKEHRLGVVVAMTPQLFKSVNGFSNLYFGNGYEDTDMFQRLKDLNISTVDAGRRDGIFLPRGNAERRTNSQDEDGLELLEAASRRAEHEGLNTLKASVQRITGLLQVFTKFHVSFDADYYIKQIDTILKEEVLST